MKPLLALLALSLAANAAMLFIRSHPATAVTSTPPAGEAGHSLPAADSATVASAVSTSHGLTADESKHRLFWKRLQAGDASAIDELRAAGWPDNAILTLVQTHIQNLYRDRMKALMPDSAKDQYWSSRSFMGNLTPEAQKAARALWREQIDLAKKLLGPAYAGLNQEYSWRDQRFASLTPAQAESVRAIEEDYSMLKQEVRGDLTGGPNLVLPEDREKLAFLEKERRADLARVLSPQELLDFELRTSPLAGTLRNNMEAFNPSEEEFRSIFTATQQATDRLGYIQPSGMWTQLDQENQRALQAEVDTQLKQILGDQRFAEYTRAQNYDYRRFYQLTKRLDLPPSAADAAYDVKLDTEKRFRELKPDPAVKDRESFNASRSLLLDEAEQKLRAALGPEGYEVYAANNGFITNLRHSLAPPPARAKATAAPSTK